MSVKKGHLVLKNRGFQFLNALSGELLSWGNNFLFFSLQLAIILDQSHELHR